MTPTLLHAVVRTADARTPDPDLLARFAQHRDGPAFAELVRRHGPLVWAVCRQLLPHHADAEDAFQAVFLALVRGAAAVRAGHALPAWLHAAAVRTALKARRAAARRRRREERVAVPEADRPVPDAAWANLMAAVHEEVRNLPDPERTAFVLCDLEGVRQPDAADRLGWPLGTLSGRLCKARQKLLDRLTRRGIAPATLALGGLAGAAGTVPAALAERVFSFPVAGAAGVSSAVAGLARGLSEGVAMRTKLVVGALMLTGAVGLGGGAMVLSSAEAQTSAVPATPPGSYALGPVVIPPPPQPRPPVPVPPVFFPPGVAPTPPVPPTAPARPGGWEYKFVDQKTADRDAFEKALTQLGAEGWEYASSERLQKGNDTQTVLVFKRPKGGPVAAAAPAPAVGTQPKVVEAVFALKKLTAKDAVNALQELMAAGTFPGSGRDTVAVLVGRNNTVVVTGPPEVVEQVGRLIEGLDQKAAGGARPGFTPPPATAEPVPAKPDGPLRVFPLKAGSAGQTAEMLRTLFRGSFVADDRSNAVVARCDDETFKEVEALLAQLEAAAARKKP